MRIDSRKVKFLFATTYLMVFLVLVAMLGRPVTAYASTTENNRLISKFTVHDNFAEDRVLVVMDKRSIMNFRSYSTNDFSEVGVKSVTNLTEKSSQALLRQMSGYQMYSPLQGESPLNRMQINADEFRTVLCLTLKEPGKENVLNAIELLKKRADIVSAEPDAVLYLESTNPNDPHYRSGDQWALNGINGINASQAWSITTGSSRVMVGVIDTGIDASHPDLVNRVNIDRSRDFSLAAPYKITNVTDGNGHGTHVAGIIGAQGNNNIGITGVNQNVEIISLRIAPTDIGDSFASHLILAIDYATAEGIHILNNSNGTDNFTGSLTSINSVETAIRNFPGLFVTSAGNGGRNNDTNNNRFPSNISLNNLISVGSINSNGNKSSFSNFGENSVHIYAPGENIFSTIPNDKYDSKDGTSMAAPHVAGVAALLLSIDPNLSAAQLRNIIINSADTITISVPNGRGGTVNQVTKRLNAYSALTYHSHSYTHTHTWFNYRQHTSSCTCGASQLRAHVVSSNWNGIGYTTCLICGGPAEIGFVELGKSAILENALSSMFIKEYFGNGSFVLSNGVIVLSDEDLVNFYKGTLLMPNPCEDCVYHIH